MIKHQCLDHGEVAFCDGCLVDSLHHEISQLKAQLNNMEACYIEKKKQVEAANTVLINWRDEYTEHTHQHECITDSVLRTCITELKQALRGDSD